jgi:hypothetical protein
MAAGAVRLAELMLGPSDHRFWRELAGAVISPSTGFNQLADGGRFRAVEPGRDPALFTRVQVGMMGTASLQNSLTQPLTRNEAVADFSVEYGIPGSIAFKNIAVSASDGTVTLDIVIS